MCLETHVVWKHMLLMNYNYAISFRAMSKLHTSKRLKNDVDIENQHIIQTERPLTTRILLRLDFGLRPLTTKIG
jgi:hypothetical protein